MSTDFLRTNKYECSITRIHQNNKDGYIFASKVYKGRFVNGANFDETMGRFITNVDIWHREAEQKRLKGE